MGNPVPSYPVDIFSRESVRNARVVDDALREFSPAARLQDGTVMITRHAGVAAGLGDWKTFSSTSRPWHDPKSVRPEILLTDDPPRHTHVRAAIAQALSPAVLAALRPAFERDAAALVQDLLATPGAVIDAVADITQRFVYKVLPDAIGIPDE